MNATPEPATVPAEPAAPLPTVPRTPATRAARVVTEIFAPAVLAATMPLVVGATAPGSLWKGIAWGAFAALFSAVIPFAIIVRGVAKGQLTDHHIHVREQRRRPLAWAVLSVTAGLVASLAFDAPRRVVAMIVIMLAVVVIIGAVNLVWKSSAHGAVAAGSATVLTLLFGPWAALSAIAVVAVCWSRVVLRDHTAAQTIVGALLGTAIAATTWLLIA